LAFFLNKTFIKWTAIELLLSNSSRMKMAKDDVPPTYIKVVHRIDPPAYFEAVINEQINPEFNHQWASDLENKSVSSEIEEVISRSRTASTSTLENADEHYHSPIPLHGGLLAVPGIYGRRGNPSRRNTVATIETNLAGGASHIQRARTISMNPPVSALWIGV
jgi:hypothetical protein